MVGRNGATLGVAVPGGCKPPGPWGPSMGDARWVIVGVAVGNIFALGATISDKYTFFVVALAHLQMKIAQNQPNTVLLKTKYLRPN